MPDNTVCELTNCVRPKKAKGLCLPHYKRMRKWGDPHITARDVRPIEVRLADPKIVVPAGSCKIWHGPLSHGYPVHGNLIVTRFVCEHTNGPAGPGQEAMHSCDTPACVEGSHLSWGSHDDNMRDMASKRRSSNGRFDEPTVRSIRAAVAGGELPSSIGRRMGVSKTAIQHIVSGVSYEWVS